jgi:hypothetical protein
MALPTPARATVIHLQAVLSGLSEVPPNASPASGLADVFVDDLFMAIDVAITFADLVAPTTAAHIHAPAPPGENAPVIVNFTTAGFPLGVTSGSYDHAFIGLADIEIAFMLAGLSYVNIHSSAFPGGEIRGQLEVVPIPASLLLLGSGLAGLAGMSRKFWRNPA